MNNVQIIVNSIFWTMFIFIIAAVLYKFMNGINGLLESLRLFINNSQDKRAYSFAKISSNKALDNLIVGIYHTKKYWSSNAADFYS